MWKGDAIFNSVGYSKRREYLREFVERLWVPDARLLGGIVTSILNPKSVSEYLENSVGLSYMIEFLPELPGKRRMWYKFGPSAPKRRDPVAVLPRFGGKPEARPLDKPEARPLDKPEARPLDKPEARPLDKPEARPLDKPEARPHAKLEVKQMPHVVPLDRPLPIKANINAIRKALAKPVDKMPDIYDLFDEQGVPISRASVQMFSLAQQLRSQMKPEGVWVSIKWRHEFGGYEILNIM
jgi:hypothetical protein